MNTDSVRLRVGLADFDQPVLLVLGDAASFCWLANWFATRTAIDFSTVPAVELMNVGLRVEVSDNGELKRDSTALVWRVSPTESAEYAEQLRNLAASDEAAHAYLDTACNSAGVEVMASMGEYQDLGIYLPRHPSEEPKQDPDSPPAGR